MGTSYFRSPACLEGFVGVKFGNSWYGVNLCTQEDSDNSQEGLLKVASLQAFQRRPSSEAGRPNTEAMLTVLAFVCRPPKQLI